MMMFSIKVEGALFPLKSKRNNTLIYELKTPDSFADCPKTKCHPQI